MSISAPIPVLFTHFGEEWFRGSEQLLLDLLINLDRSRIKPILWCNSDAMTEAAHSAKITTYRSQFVWYFDYGSARFNLSHYWSLVREAICLIRRHDIQVLHANSAAPNQWLFPAARSTHKPLLVHLHIGYLRRSRFACLLHQATLIVGVSRQVTQDLLLDGMKAERMETIYNGIDFGRLEAQGGGDVRQELGIPSDAAVITVAGSLIRRKGQDVLIRAFAMLIENRNIHLLIAGDGQDRHIYVTLVTDLGMQAKVHFLGHRDDMSAIYRATDVIALPSRSDAFGLVLAEAAYFGVPAVATAVGGVPEVVENGVTGLLVPPDDPTVLAQALGRLIDNPALRRTFGLAAKARAEQVFSVERMVEHFHATYERLAGLSPRHLGWFGAGLSCRPFLRALTGR